MKMADSELERQYTDEEIEAYIDEFEQFQTEFFRSNRGMTEDFRLESYQRESCEHIIRSNGVIASLPTGSGKTIIAEFASWFAYQLGRSVIFPNPLKALSTEKYDEWNEKYPDWKIIRDTSDDRKKRSEQYYRGFNILVTTYERLDSLLRKKKWRRIVLKDVRTVVYDEIHLLGTLGRGSSVEASILSIKLLSAKNITHDMGIVGLSATLVNDEEFAEWVGVPLVSIPAEDRPVPLYHDFDQPPVEGSTSKERTEQKLFLLLDLIMDFPSDNFLIFTSSRKRTKKIAYEIAQKKAPKNLKSFRKLKHNNKELLSTVMDYGVAFHNAGLTEGQRKEVEDKFRDGTLKHVCATPTLAQGVNVPARRVVIFDLSRWKGLLSRHKLIEDTEVNQQAGRGGRRGYDTRGDAHYLGTSYEIMHAWEAVMNPTPMRSVLYEKIEGKMLAIVVSGITNRITELREAIMNSFFSLHEPEKSEEMFEQSLKFLIKNGFLNKLGDDLIQPKKLGKYTSYRYLNPRSVISMRESFDIFRNFHPDRITEENGAQVRDFMIACLSIPEVVEQVHFEEGIDNPLLNATIEHFFPNGGAYPIELWHQTEEGMVKNDDTMNLYKILGVAYGKYFKKRGIQHFTHGSRDEARYMIQTWIDIGIKLAPFFKQTYNVVDELKRMGTVINRSFTMNRPPTPTVYEEEDDFDDVFLEGIDDPDDFIDDDEIVLDDDEGSSAEDDIVLE